MKFWVVKWDNCIGVDNDNVGGADMTPMPSHVNFMMWEGDTGAVHYDDRAGLAERIIDPTPYLWCLDHFISIAQEAVPPINLDQAKTIKRDANNLVFNGKRQAPINYTGHLWDATDEEVAAMNNELSGNTQTTDQLVSQINSSIVAKGNAGDASIVNQSNAGLYNPVYTIVQQANGIFNTIVASVNNNLATPTINLFTQLKAIWGSPAPEAGWLANPTLAASAQISQLPSALTAPAPMLAIPAPSAVTYSWYPLASSTPVAMTHAEFSGLVKAIAVRRASLAVVQRTNRAAIYACATIDDVVAIDLATGWPTSL